MARGAARFAPRPRCCAYSRLAIPCWLLRYINGSISTARCIMAIGPLLLRGPRRLKSTQAAPGRPRALLASKKPADPRKPARPNGRAGNNRPKEHPRK